MHVRMGFLAREKNDKGGHVAGAGGMPACVCVSPVFKKVAITKVEFEQFFHLATSLIRVYIHSTN